MQSPYEITLSALDNLFSVPDNFGIVRREFTIGAHRAVLYFTDGLNAGDEAEHVLAFCKHAESSDAAPYPIDTVEAFCAAYISYPETEISADINTLHTGVMTGCLLLVLELFPTKGILIKNRQTPTRSLAEPEHDKVLRGAHVGFVETLPLNCAMIRRLLPDPHLMMKRYSIGQYSRTGVVMCYMRGSADEKYLSFLDKKLNSIHTDSLSLGTQSLAECLVKRRTWNPFPYFRYTERPDSAVASLVEGSIILLCENAPQAMILPVSIFSYLQETNDFYIAPFTATYLRLLRLFSFLCAIYLIPVWYAAVMHTAHLPHWLSFLELTEPSVFPILAQLILIELAVDALKLASMNTPTALSNSLSVIGGLILGDFAVQTGLFMPETILYMAVVSIAHFTQHNYELGYAFKYTRVMMLLLTAVLGWWGIAVGTVVLIVFLVTVPALEEKPRYFYPLIPFNGKALYRFFFRQRKMK